MHEKSFLSLVTNMSLLEYWAVPQNNNNKKTLDELENE